LIIIPTHSIFYSMRIVSIIKPVLFLYECSRIIVFTLVMVYMIQEINAAPWLVFASPAIMFPLMTLFLWIDASRYRAYLPLFRAGKCTGIFFMLICLIVVLQGNMQVTMLGSTNGTNFIIGMFFFGISGDLFSLAAALLISRDLQKYTKKPAVIDTQITEDKQCE